MRNDAILSDESFLKIVKSTLIDFARGQGLEDLSDAVDIEIPSASLDATGRPRFTMTLPASLIVNDLGAAHVFYHDVAGRGFEFALRRFLDLHLLSDDVFMDVGAHWGIHSLTAATCRPRQVSVLAIEAHSANVAILRNWVQRNHLEPDVEVISKAIGDREGTARMWISGSSMGHSLRAGGSEAGLTAIDVDVTTVDRLLDDRPHLRWRRFFLKIDVEGCELEVLAGAGRLFAREHVAAVIWEKAAFHERSVQGRRDDDVFNFLNSHGFEHFYMEDENMGGRLIPVEGTDTLGNIYSLAPDFERKERYG